MTDNTDDIELKTLMEGLAKATAEVKDWHRAAKSEIESLGKMSKETKDGADKALAEMNTKMTGLYDDFEKKSSARILDTEQKVPRRSGGTQFEETKSPGTLVIENEAVKSTLLGGAN